MAAPQKVSIMWTPVMELPARGGGGRGLAGNSLGDAPLALRQVISCNHIGIRSDLSVSRRFALDGRMPVIASEGR